MKLYILIKLLWSAFDFYCAKSANHNISAWKQSLNSFFYSTVSLSLGLAFLIALPIKGLSWAQEIYLNFTRDGDEWFKDNWFLLLILSLTLDTIIIYLLI